MGGGVIKEGLIATNCPTHHVTVHGDCQCHEIMIVSHRHPWQKTKE